MGRSQGLKVCYYILYDCTEEVLSEMKSKLKELSRTQLETLICVLSREIGRLEHLYSTCLTNRTNTVEPQKNEKNMSPITLHGNNEASVSSNEACDAAVQDNDMDTVNVQSSLEIKAANEGLVIAEDRNKRLLDVIHTKDGRMVYSKSWIDSETSNTAKRPLLMDSSGQNEIIQEKCMEPQLDVKVIHKKSLTGPVCQTQSEDTNMLRKSRSSWHLAKYRPLGHVNKLKRNSKEVSEKVQSSFTECTEMKIVCCDQCDKTFRTNCLLKKHLRLVHNQTKTTTLCPYCGKLVLHSRLKSHLEKVHEKPSNSCHICGRGFLKRECLEGHLNKHTNTKPYVCEFCGRKYTYSTSLSSHRKHCTKSLLPPHLQQSKSREDKNVLRICEICGKTFEGMSGLKDHFSAKHSSKIQNCCHCGKGFRWRPSYNRHVKICQERSDAERVKFCKSVRTASCKLFSCECGKRYPYRQSFRRHQKTCLHKQQLESYVISSSSLGKISGYLV